MGTIPTKTVRDEDGGTRVINAADYDPDVHELVTDEAPAADAGDEGQGDGGAEGGDQSEGGGDAGDDEGGEDEEADSLPPGGEIVPQPGRSGRFHANLHGAPLVHAKGPHAGKPRGFTSEDDARAALWNATGGVQAGE